MRIRVSRHGLRLLLKRNDSGSSIEASEYGWPLKLRNAVLYSLRVLVDRAEPLEASVPVLTGPDGIDDLHAVYELIVALYTETVR